MTMPPPAYPVPGTDQPYAPPVAPAGPKVSVAWTGVLLALGALVAVVGTFLPFEKIVFFDNGSVVGTFSLTGLGSTSVTGESLQGLQAGNAGRIILAMSVLGLVFAALVLAKRGRIWVGILALLTSAFALIMGLASLAAPASDQKDLVNAGIEAHGLTKMGSTIATVGAGVAVLASVLALIVRRRRA